MYSTALFNSYSLNFPPPPPPPHAIKLGRPKPHAVVAPLHAAIAPPLPQDSPTSQDGDYKVKPNEILHSPNAVYEVLEYIGRGTFGQVVKCTRKDNGEHVAIKILKNHPNYARQGQVEIQILQHLSSESSDKHNFVKALECFKHRNHTCLVFEILEKNLFDYLKLNKFSPMPLNHIRPILHQILTALIKLSELEVIHADVKPENIMLVDQKLDSFRVKLIDFGSATYKSRALDNTYLQSRYYRAPEVIVGVPFTEKIDIWSLGCVIAELFLGYPLYPGGCEYDQIRFITSTEGLPPVHMMERGKKTRQYFLPPATAFSGTWRLKTEEQYHNETGTRPKETRRYKFSRLQDLVMFGLNDTVTEEDRYVEDLDRREFVSLLMQMLHLDPAQRASPAWCKSHEFVTMNHLQKFVYCKRVRRGIEVMQRACKREKQVNRLMMTPQQHLQYLQAINQAQREQLLSQQIKEQQELQWSLQTNPALSLQYLIGESVHSLERRSGIYPTPDWSPGTSDWAPHQPEYGTKAHPIVIPDSPTRPDQLLQEQLYKAQIIRNLTALQQKTSSLDSFHTAAAAAPGAIPGMHRFL